MGYARNAEVWHPANLTGRAACDQWTIKSCLNLAILKLNRSFLAASSFLSHYFYAVVTHVEFPQLNFVSEVRTFDLLPVLFLFFFLQHHESHRGDQGCTDGGTMAKP